MDQPHEPQSPEDPRVVQNGFVQNMLIQKMEKTSTTKPGRLLKTWYRTQSSFSVGAITTGVEQILCDVNNEGGLQEGFDILPIIKEESYLKAFPEERKSRAFLEFCAEGDVGAILDLLNSEDEEDSTMNGNAQGAARPIDVLRYQDPLGSMSTGLHVAIRNGREEIAWLLLFLASSLELKFFPPDVIQAAEMLGARREEHTGKVDIRVLEDAEHRTAEQLAKEVGGKWDEWIHSGRLKPILDGILPVV
ncbi:MAG: hypothetical protein Q9219_006553 [cf. Caloplaca sp. 3 TL-2023]